MNSYKESGHTKNVDNFSILKDCCRHIPSYNPGRSALSFQSIDETYNEAFMLNNIVSTAQGKFDYAVSQRDNAMTDFGFHITSVYNSVKALEVTPEVIDHVLTVVRLIRGQRVSHKLTKVEIDALIKEGKEVPEQISAAHAGNGQKIYNYNRLLQLLQSIPTYKPNEEDLSINGVNTRYQDLLVRQKYVEETYNNLVDARIRRDLCLYEKDKGLVDIALGVKTYVKSLCGYKSDFYKQISSLRFRRLN